MIQYLHKVSESSDYNIQCLITIGEERRIFKMVINKQDDHTFEEIQCYGIMQMENDNHLLIIEKILMLNFNSSFTKELFMDDEKIYFILEHKPSKLPINKECKEYTYLKQGATININQNYDTNLSFINYSIPDNCSEPESNLFNKLHHFENTKFIKL